MPRSTARRLGVACAADQVILFGSRAKGQAATDRDVDLALILPDGTDTRVRLQEAHRLLWPRRFPVDLVAIPASVWRGKTTCCPGKSPLTALCSMTAERLDPSEPKRWLESAREDLAYGEGGRAGARLTFPIH